MVKRVKPTNELRAATHPASDDDYQRLAVAVVQAITLKQHNIIVRFPYFCKLPDDWPRGIRIKRDESYDYFKIKTFKAATWLHEHGYLAQGPKELVKSQRSVVNMLGEIDRMFASPQQEFLRNDKIPVDKIYGGAYNVNPVGYEIEEGE